MPHADFHASVVLQTRLPGGEMDEDLREAARAAAEAASDVLASSDFGGGSASVDFRVEYGVRTVPQATPADRRFVAETDARERTPDPSPDNDFGDEDVPDLSEDLAVGGESDGSPGGIDAVEADPFGE